LVKHFVRVEEVAALMVTHHAEDALRISDRLMLLEGTQSGAAGCVQLDTPENVYKRPVSAHVARLTGQVISVRCFANGLKGTNSMGEFELNQSSDGEVDVLFRPEDIDWSYDPNGAFRIISTFFAGPGHSMIVEDQTGHRLTLSHLDNKPDHSQRLSLRPLRAGIVERSIPKEAR